MKRYLLAATLLALQTAAVFAVNPPKRSSRGGRSNVASGEMRGRGEQVLAPFAAPIKNADVAAFEKELANYRGGKLGLYAIVGKIAIAVDENHADTSISQGDMAAKTRHLHQMRDMVLEKLKTHTATREARPMRGERKGHMRGMRKGRMGAARKTAAGTVATKEAAAE